MQLHHRHGWHDILTLDHPPQLKGTPTRFPAFCKLAQVFADAQGFFLEVRVIDGETFDVAANLRRGSPNIWPVAHRDSSRRALALSLDSKWLRSRFPLLSRGLHVVCKATDYDRSECERTLMWNDSEQGIDWQLDSEPVVPAKDASDSWPQAAEVFDWGSLKWQDSTTPRSHQNTKAHPWVRH